MHDDTISMKLRGPTHSDGNGSWYKIGVHFNGKPFFGKEWEHSGREEDDLNTGDSIINVGKIVGKWVGVKVIYDLIERLEIITCNLFVIFQ